MAATASDYSDKELMAVFISRQIRDGEFVNVGTNLPIPRAGVLLAHFTRCPNLRLGVGGGVIANFLQQPRVESFEFIGDYRSYVAAEAFLPMDFENLRRFDLFFVGGLQIDRYGNTNLIGIGKDYPRLRFRGPGTVGIASITTHARRYFIFSSAHNPRVFVERCEYVSSVGWNQGGADARRKLGLPGGGPQFVITPLCVMDFEEETKRMRLKHVAPRSSVEEIVKNTGFELIIPPNLEPLDPPTAAELAVLRVRVDPEGVLRSAGE